MSVDIRQINLHQIVILFRKTKRAINPPFYLRLVNVLCNGNQTTETKFMQLDAIFRRTRFECVMNNKLNWCNFSLSWISELSFSILFSIKVSGFWFNYLLPTTSSEKSSVAILYDRAGRVCIMVSFSIQLNISHRTNSKRNSEKLRPILHALIKIWMNNVSSCWFSGGKLVYGLYELSDDTKTINYVNGMCDDDQSDQLIQIHWMEKGRQNAMNLTFHRNKNSREYSLNRIDFKLFVELLTNSTVELLLLHHTGEVFKVPLGMSYHCFKVNTFKLSSDKHLNNLTGTVSFTRITAEAYRTTTQKSFSTAIDCTIFGTPSEFKLDNLTYFPCIKYCSYV